VRSRGERRTVRTHLRELRVFNVANEPRDSAEMIAPTPGAPAPFACYTVPQLSIPHTMQDERDDANDNSIFNQPAQRRRTAAAEASVQSTVDYRISHVESSRHVTDGNTTSMSTIWHANRRIGAHNDTGWMRPVDTRS
jgi:hypothetical protein